MLPENSEDNRKALDLKLLASAVSRRGMLTPAIFFLEAHKPLTSFVNFAAHLCAPVLVPLFGRERMGDICRLLEEPDRVEELIQELERLQTGGA